MKKSLMVAALSGLAGSLLFLATPLASARDHVNWSVNIGVPVATYPAYSPAYAPSYAPVYSPPPVVYARPAPAYYEPAPVYYGPPPVVYAPQPYSSRVYYDGYARPYYWDHGRRGHGYGHGGHHGYGR